MPARIKFCLAVLLLYGAGYAGGRCWAWRTAERAQGRVLARSEPVAGRAGAVELLSGRYVIDRMYQSMLGPSSNLPDLQLCPGLPADEVLYLTGAKAEVVEADSEAPVSPEFFCHSNLTLSPQSTSPAAHNAGFAAPMHMDWRFFTLVPGRMELHLPEGFGIPIRNATRLDCYTMSLNQNPGIPKQAVRIRSRFDFARGGQGMRPVFRRALYVYQHFTDGGGQPALAIAAAEHQGAACGLNCDRNQRAATPSLAYDLSEPLSHPGASCCVENASAGGVMDQFGHDNTIHWMVPPGRHAFKTDVSRQMELPFDTTAHYVTGHLHPCGTGLRLVDLDTGSTVFDIASQDFADKTGVQHMAEISSKEGVPLKKDGRYELVAEYDNGTSHPIDVMAILYLYLAETPPGKAGGVASR